MNEIKSNPEQSSAQDAPCYEVMLAKLPRGWTARCYHEDGEHVWSSEEAATVRLALSEIASAVSHREAA